MERVYCRSSVCLYRSDAGCLCVCESEKSIMSQMHCTDCATAVCEIDFMMMIAMLMMMSSC